MILTPDDNEILERLSATGSTPDSVANLLRSTARELLNEFESPTNKLTYRQLLDKHALKVAHMLPRKPPAWLQLNYVCHEVYAEK